MYLPRPPTTLFANFRPNLTSLHFLPGLSPLCTALPPKPDYLFITSAGNKDISNALPCLSPSTSKIAKKEYKMQMTTEENRGKVQKRVKDGLEENNQGWKHARVKISG